MRDLLKIPLLTLLGCKPAEVQSSPAPEPAPPPGAPAWGCPLGGALAGVTLRPEVAAGRYDLEAGYSQNALPTMEREVRRGIAVRAWMNLAEDGSFDACLGTQDSNSSTVSQYESKDGQRHDYKSDTNTLMHLRGRWEQAYDGARLTVERVGYNDCQAAAETMSPYGVLPMVCGTLPAGGPLPTATLACRALGHLAILETLGLELGASSRQGAWAMRYPPMDRSPPDLTPACGPWLVFGAAPGLHVTVQEQDRDDRPTLSFKADVRPMVEADYAVRQP